MFLFSEVQVSHSKFQGYTVLVTTWKLAQLLHERLTAITTNFKARVRAIVSTILLY